MMDIKSLFLGIALLAGGPVMAQIDFREGNLKDILQLAKNENKLVFVDCYTSWCGPCKILSARVFSRPEVGEYFNARFVSLKMDMEKGEGKTYREKYDVNAYPTLLFLDTSGQLLCRYSGYLEPDQLMAFAGKEIQEQSLVEMQKRYEKGERSAGFIRTYLAELDEACMSAAVRRVADDYLRGKAEEVFRDTNVYAVFHNYVNTPEDSFFLAVYARKAEYAGIYGERAAQRLEEVWINYGRRFLRREGKEVAGYDPTGLKAYLAFMKENRVPEAGGIYATHLIDGAVAEQDWPTVWTALQTYATYSGLEEGKMCLTCERLAVNLQDKKSLKKLAVLVKKRATVLDGLEDTSGRTMTIGDETMPIMEYYRRSYEQLYKELKQK